jgi:hypothetical protein
MVHQATLVGSFSCCHPAPSAGDHMSQRRRHASPSSHKCRQVATTRNRREHRCAYILGLAAQHIQTTSSFVIDPASANPRDDKHFACKNRLLIVWWILTRIEPTSAPQVQEQEPADRKLITMVVIRIFVRTDTQHVTRVRGRQDICFLSHDIMPTL